MKKSIRVLLPRLAVAAAAIALLVASTVQISPAFSQSKYPVTSLIRCTRDDAILKALALLEGTQGEESLNRVVQKPVRIVFKDMKMVHKALKNYDALSWLSNEGEQVIFINEKHRNAPPEALASMIAHEAMHSDAFNSLTEEVESWKQEAQVWIELKSRNVSISLIPAGQSPLVDRENRIEQEYRRGSLASFVRSSPGYQGLPENSPGFGPTAISSQDYNSHN